MQQDPPEHTARRRPLAAALSPRAVEDMVASVVEPLAAELVRTFADRVRREDAADLVGAVYRPLPTAVLAGLLGLPSDVDRAWLTAESLAMVRVEELASPPSVVRRADEAATAQLTCYDRVLADRSERPAGEDLLSCWAAEAPAEARYLMLALFSAGVPTTAALLASLALALVTRPGLAERIHLEPDFADRLIDEVLRWDPPVRVVTRVAYADTVLGGRMMPAGQVVHALIGAAHRDPDLFADPHTFDPRDVPQRLLAFGSGLHYCPGTSLARAQAIAFVQGFAHELPGARLAAAPVRQPGPSMNDITRLAITLASTQWRP